MKTMFTTPVRHLLFRGLACSLQGGLLLAIPCAVFSQAPAPASGTASGSGTSNTGAVQKLQSGTPIAEGPSLPGAIGTWEANGFSLATTGGAAARFLFGEDTLFLDSEGRPLPRERFTSQTPAIVYYTTSGNHLIATKVVATAKDTPTVFTVGTITEVNPGILIIEQPGASPTPVRYVNNNTTNYVDQNGEPVRPEMVKTGMPVKVFYTKVGDTLVASKVEVQLESAKSGLPKPAIKETTTTTTIEKKP